MMKFPCSVCGGKGPHDGPGHSYTTDPDPHKQEEYRRQRFIDSIIVSDASELGKLAICLAISGAPNEITAISPKPVQFVCVIRTNSAVLGLFDTEDQAKEAAIFYMSDEDYDHADVNADFYVTRLIY